MECYPLAIATPAWGPAPFTSVTASYIIMRSVCSLHSQLRKPALPLPKVKDFPKSLAPMQIFSSSYRALAKVKSALMISQINTAYNICLSYLC